ncbi:hypothetical protein WJX81_001826 [Elliptochloris bilobata]|uniref:Uncharacterized protein n=1 Tax=Elliptochloris bilobata TaxID=381761 RepID=A0AAW1RR92_9CHLO
METKITAFFAALLGFLYVALSLAVVRVRRSARIPVGEGVPVNTLLRKRIRAHANFGEYVPLALVLLALVEGNKAAPAPLIGALGTLLLLARISHGWALAPQPAGTTIWLQTGPVNTRTAEQSRGVESRRSVLAEAAAQDPQQDPRWNFLAGAVQFLVALAPPVCTSDVHALRASLATLGGHVLNYVPDHALLVAAPRSAAGPIRELPGVTWVGDLAPEHKVAAAWQPLLAWLDMLTLTLALDPADGAALQAAALADMDVQAALQWLAAQPPVHWVAPRPRARLHNFLATGICQSGAAGGADLTAGTTSGGNATHPLWLAGLQGAGQVIGMGDTGLDVGHCLFRDDAVLVPTTLAGGLQQGMAPAAKLAFQDLGSGTSGSIDLPGDLAANYYPFSYTRGAHIHSDSWGTSTPDYDGLAFAVDYFAWANQDFLPVGADGTVPFKVMGASFGPSVATLAAAGSQKLAIVGAAPAIACEPLTARLHGAMALVLRGNCTFSTKAANAQAAGAAAVLVVNTDDSGFFRMDQEPAYSGAAIHVPVCGVSQAPGALLWAALATGAPLSVAFSAYALPTDRYESLAFFSSIGPTLDGRIKPDIVAPGTTISAFAAQPEGSQTCSLAVERGTSMATPVVAGGLALIRQYFAGGWYPSGEPQAASAFLPSAPLLKAVLLGGAAAMQGIAPSANAQYNGVPLDTPPSVRQGFGRAHLGRSLPLAGGVPGWNLQVVDRAVLPDTGAMHKYCLSATGGALRVTLAWADRPPAQAAGPQLVNDLDLQVRANSLAGYNLPGNGVIDRVNNVEQVAIDSMDAGLVVITVMGFCIPFGPQNYSLAVQGNFSGWLESSYNPAWDGVARTVCLLPVAAISAAPPPLGNASLATFTFASSDPAPGGFECRLSGTGGVTWPLPLHGWAACTSPAAAAILSDGSYLFSVRAAGYIVQDARAFTVDMRAPVSSITGALAPVAGAPRSAVFSFAANDSAPVTFACRLNGSAWQTAPLPPAFAATLGAWLPCQSPQEYDSLPAGNWTFGILATDAAGNMETHVQSAVPWQVDMAAFVQITGGDAGATVSRNSVSFQFGAVISSQAPPGEVPMECALQAWGSSGFVPPAPAFAACTSPAAYGALHPGVYLFSALLQGGDPTLAATAQVQVNVQGPQAIIMAGPPAVTGVPAAEFFFSAEGAAGFGCRLQGGGAASQAAAANASTFTACSSPTTYNALVDGSYSFQVQALGTAGAAGMAGPAASATFLIDTTPPVVSKLRFMLAALANGPTHSPTPNPTSSAAPAPGGGTTVSLASGAFTAAFDVTDGVLGSGVNGSSCQMSAVTDVSGTAMAGATGRGATGVSLPCSPAGTAYSLDSGTYIFQVMAADNANNTAAPLAATLHIGGSAGSGGVILIVAPSSAKAAGGAPVAVGAAAAALVAVTLWVLLS